jgi:hypothetical protein
VLGWGRAGWLSIWRCGHGHSAWLVFWFRDCAGDSRAVLSALGTTVSVRHAGEAGLQCGAGRDGERESAGARLSRRAGEPGDDHAGAGHGGYFEAGDKQVSS